MPAFRIGTQTVHFDTPPHILSSAAVGGKKEGEGPLAADFDYLSQDDSFGEKTFEKAESAMQKKALEIALTKGCKTVSDLDFLLAGDLLNQCIGSSFAARGQNVPFLGLYGACSTMGESLAMAAMLVAGGCGDFIAAMTSSHFCTAERQYRTPLEYGGQRTPTAQWTATAAGAALVSKVGKGPRITCVTIGKIIDKGICDANNMGAAMAPAAYETLRAHFADTGRDPDYYDLIVTGDLGKLGHEIVEDFFRKDGVSLMNYSDCGLLLYDRERQDAHCGASGCGCAGSVLCGHLLGEMARGRWKKLLFCPTGALLSPTSTQQGESIPAVAHAVAIEV